MPPGDDASAMSAPILRRRFVAAALPLALAGCIEDPDQQAQESSEESTSDPSTESVTPTETAVSTETATPTETPTPERVDPGEAGIAVTLTEVVRVTDENTERDVRAQVEIRNDGRFEYGLLEFRVDAYEIGRNGSREARAFAYVTRHWPDSDTLSKDDRSVISVTISFPESDARRRADADNYEVDVAIRRAEPA